MNFKLSLSESIVSKNEKKGKFRLLPFKIIYMDGPAFSTKGQLYFL
jgi:hypothetical protein